MKEDFFNAMQALAFMKQSLVVRSVNTPGLFAFEKAKVIASLPNFTARLSEDDFLELYGHFKFVLQKESDLIDVKKDEEYYAWRAEKQ